MVLLNYYTFQNWLFRLSKRILLLCKMDNISNLTTNDDFLSFTQTHLARNFCLAVSIVTFFTCIPLFIFIVWFEKYGSDKKRTILNMFVSKIILSCIFYLLFPHTIELLRFGLGPLSGILCGVHQVVKVSLAFTLVSKTKKRKKLNWILKVTSAVVNVNIIINTKMTIKWR